MVVFVFFALGFLLVICLGEGDEDMDGNGGEGDDDYCGIFRMCFKWRRERVYMSATEGCEIGAESCQILVGGVVWSLCDLDLEEEARQKVGRRNKFNLIGDSY